MPQYGDALLKAMTLDVLEELFGKNPDVSRNIFPLAISNAFYEQIVLHYQLDLEDESAANNSKGTTHRRGDLLEAYMAAIEKDISRDGEGYREVREWLFRVLALRLRRLGIQNEMALYSRGTEQQSLTILPPVSGGATVLDLQCEVSGSKIVEFRANRSRRSADQAISLPLK
jgi:hypothetical protein